AGRRRECRLSVSPPSAAGRPGPPARPSAAGRSPTLAARRGAKGVRLRQATRRPHAGGTGPGGGPQAVTRRTTGPGAAAEPHVVLPGCVAHHARPAAEPGRRTHFSRSTNQFFGWPV